MKAGCQVFSFPKHQRFRQKLSTSHYSTSSAQSVYQFCLRDEDKQCNMLLYNNLSHKKGMLEIVKTLENLKYKKIKW